MNTTHKNNKVVKVVSKLPFYHTQMKEQKDWFDQANRSVGGYFESSSSRRVGTGLTTLEKQMLLVDFLDVNPVTGKVDKKIIDEYYTNLSIKIPTILNIGLEKSNEEEMDMENNPPLKLEDYIRYRFLLGHPKVANSENEAKGNPLVDYYIIDEDKVVSQKNKVNDIKDLAMVKYLGIKDKASTVTMYLELLGINTSLIKASEQSVNLRKIAEGKPARFLEIANDAKQQEKHFITKCVNNGLLEIVGTNYLISESQEKIGSDLKETVLYLEAKGNLAIRNRLQARLAEFKKK